MNISKKGDYYVNMLSKHLEVNLDLPGVVKVNNFWKTSHVDNNYFPQINFHVGDALVYDVQSFVKHMEEKFDLWFKHGFFKKNRADLNMVAVKSNMLESATLLKSFMDEVKFSIGAKFASNEGLKLTVHGFLEQKITLRASDPVEDTLQTLMGLLGYKVELDNVRTISYKSDEPLKLHKLNLMLILKTCLGVI